jgi:sugar phosphate isomerase/epimerase
MERFMNAGTTRRGFLGAGMSALGGTWAAPRRKRVPIALELYSVREECKKDLQGTVRAVGRMGYEGVEYFATYFDFGNELAKELRQIMDELKIQCCSTHNSAKFLAPENLDRAIELNQILGSRTIIQASAPKIANAQGWREVGERLNAVAAKLKPLGMRVGYHNHDVEFRPLEGQLPFEILAENTSKDVILQFDVGAAISAGADPVAWIKRYPGRTVLMHVKDYSKDPAKGFRVLLGEGDAPWKEIFQAAESVGGVEVYIIEQEGSALPPLETVERCLKNWRKLRG